MRHLTATRRHFLAAIAALILLTLPATSDVMYTVRSGDSVWTIAKKHHISHLALLRENGLGTKQILQPGQQLVIPGVSSAKASSSRSSAAGAEQAHVVQQGDSLWLIARQHGVTVRALAKANSLRSTAVLRVGSRLKIPGTAEPAAEKAASPAAEAPKAAEAKAAEAKAAEAKAAEAKAAEAEAAEAEAAEPATHFVRDGESLWTIARKYGTSVQALAAANGLRPESVLRVGRELTIPGEGSAESADEGPRTRLYIVKSGDSLWEIARRHGTTVRSLAAANGLDADRVLRVGMTLQVPDVLANLADDAEGNRFVRAALEYRGVRYRWGGMSTRGMDCSGLVALVLRDYGINAPHNSKALYKLGEAVSREELEPGDLVFFHTTRPGISHVGMYIGEGKFVHASSSKGRVRVDRLDTGYYSKRLVGARRVS